MTGPLKTPERDVVGTYELFAPYYDAFTADYPYDEWVGDLELWARGNGLRGRRLLDVACGTGNSSLPLLARGYEVVGCDISPAMLAHARSKIGARAHCVVADMRSLPFQERFDLVTCIDDSINYLLSEADLVAALRGIVRALAPGGLAVFDANSLAAYRTGFASEAEIDTGGARFRWRGEGDGTLAPGGLAAATIELLVEGGEPVAIGRHVQRHHPPATIRAACAEAGLELLDVRGAAPEGGLDPRPDEERHQKIAFLTARVSR